MRWDVEYTDESEAWWNGLSEDDQERVRAAVELLESAGPPLGRPLVDTLEGSRLPNLKELRPRGGHLRVLFVFDPRRVVILLLGGDKRGLWQAWYAEAMPGRSVYTTSTSRSCAKQENWPTDRRPGEGPKAQGDEAMPKTKPFRQLADKIDADPARRARVDDYKRVMLAELRQSLDLTQTELADRLEVSQRGVSHVEHEANPRLRTLADYVGALGGRLELRAVFDDRTVELTLPAGSPNKRTPPAPRGRARNRP